MHNSATIKPYLSIIRFVAPPSGTGTITVRALIKTGVANTGDFFLPYTDLVLQETYYEPAWFAANAGETCSDCCLRNGRTGFDAVTQAALFPAETFRVAVEKKVVCNLPLLSSCSAEAPVIDANNYCYMRESNCTPSWRSTAPVPNSRNLCACVVQSSASTMSISRWVLALLGLSALSSQKRYIFIYLVLACVFLPSAQAHNWLHTPGRASTQASTIFPCQGRKASDLHAQLSRTQTFNTKWAVGHDRDSYFVLIHEKDQDMLAQSDFEEMVDDYLAKGTKAPYNAPNLANDPQWMRYHGTYADPSTRGMYDNSKLPGSLFSGEVLSTDGNFLRHPRSNATSWQFRYTDASRANDIRLNYASTEYPWIESAMRVPHLYHMPDDFNIFRTQVAGRSGDGHYILHWRWSGYFDCIDLDLRSSAVTNVYGQDGDGYIFNRIDHCQYLEPNDIVTPCVEVTWSVASCIDRLPGWMDTNRLGVNVVPFKNPASVYKAFQNNVNIPWSNGDCADNSWLRIGGTVTESAIDFSSASVFKSTKYAGQMCTSTMQPCNGGSGGCSLGGGDYYPRDGVINFRRAIALCVGHRSCVGVSVMNDGTFPANTIPTDTGKHTILLCTGTARASNSSFTSYFPSGLATYSDIASPVTKVYSFLPSTYKTLPTPAPNNYRDFGDPYSTTTGMGWSCNISVDCPWCCGGYDCGNNPPSGNNPYSYHTFQYIQGKCDNNQDLARKWEVAVTNGVYDVSVYSDLSNSDPTAWVSGCNVEGALMRDVSDEPPQPVTITRRVEVRDGRLTVDGEAASDRGCNAINWISVKQIRPQWDEVWYPATSNPWWQMKFDKMQPVGVVQIRGINYYYETGGGNRQLNCAGWWMFRGSRCYDGRPIGWFNASDEGVIVGVSNSSTACSGSGCTGVVCGALRQGVDEWAVWQQYIDCKGVVAQYVWVYLPGTARSLVFDVLVSRAVPDIPAALQDTHVCYGVEARPQTATTPEFVISTDPEDPIFYSTCYSREKNITWLTPNPPLDVSAPVPRWRFNQHCLDCATYHHNAQALPTTEIPSPWVIADGKCANCDLEGNPPAVQKTKSKWIQAWRGYFTDDKVTCAANSNISCAKSLDLGGRGPNDDWTQQAMDATDCQVLAERDPDCLPIVRYNRAWWNSDISAFQPNGRDCECWRKDACCGRPVVFSWDSPQTDGNEVYRSDDGVTPDPTCASGIKSTDNAMCCPSYCVDSTGKNVCGWAGGNCYSGVVGGGSCCSNATLARCANTGAPCLL